MLLLFDLACSWRLGALTRFIPITDVRGFPDSLSERQRREWAVMDTFDGLSPKYDNPQKVENVVQMFTLNGCEVLHAGVVSYGSGTAMVVRAVKRSSNYGDDHRTGIGSL